LGVPPSLYNISHSYTKKEIYTGTGLGRKNWSGGFSYRE